MNNFRPKYLLDHFETILNLIQNAQRVFYFFDYDGTLVPYAEKPWLAIPSKEVKETINQLSFNEKFKIIIISGRAIETIKKIMPLKNVIYAGDHGLNIEFLNGEKFFWEKASKVKPLIKLILKKLNNKFINDEQIIIEDKNLNLSVHFRLVQDKKKIDSIIKYVFDLVKKIDKEKNLESFLGVKIVEVRPKGWNKGKVIDILKEKFNFSSKDLLFFFGDDKTDEDGFKKLGENGVSVFVRNDQVRDSYAFYYVNNPFEVLGFLNKILKIYNW